MMEKKEKLKELYRAKNKLFKEDWLDTILRLTDNASLEAFVYAIDAAILMKGFKFDDIVPFIKDVSLRQRLKEHREIKEETFEDVLEANKGSRAAYLRLIANTLKFKNWPEGMTYMIFHQGVAGKWGICQTEDQRVAVMGESEGMFKTIKDPP